jgi:hypothetical protein
MINEEDNNPF